MLYSQSWYLPLLIGTVVVYWLVMRTPLLRKLTLIAASLALLASLQPGFTAMLVVWTVLIYACGRRLKDREASNRLRLLLFTIVALVGYLSFFKYLPGLLKAVFGDGGGEGVASILHDNIVLPLGISYFTFRFLHYVIDAYRGQLDDYTFLDFALYSVFFPILPAGPIERIERFIGNANSSFAASDFSYGIERILVGAAKKLLLVDIVLVGLIGSGPSTQILSGNIDGLSLVDVWVFLILSFLYGYLDFSAYSDLAIGTARLFGYRICENFEYPILRRNLSEFWQHWHMSLSGWCRDYIYMPVLGRTRRQRLALYASMMTIGAWHFINFNWLVWGALHASGLVCVMEWQRYARRKKIARYLQGSVGYGVGMVLTFLYVSWVFAFVSIPSPVAATRAFIYAISGVQVL